jgi:hypothetical protein
VSHGVAFAASVGTIAPRFLPENAY